MAEQPTDIRKKQLRNAGIVVGILLGIIWFGMWFSDPNKGKPTAREMAIERAKEMEEKYRVRASASVSDEEQWIARSEERMAALEMQFKRQQREKETYEKKIQALEKRLEEGGYTKVVVQEGEPSTDEGMRPAKVREPIPTAGGTKVALDDRLPAPPIPIGPTVTQPPSTEVTDEKGQLPPQVRPPAPGVGKGSDTPGDMIMEIDLSDQKRSKSSEKRLNVASAIPAGAFGRAELLMGMDAPTLNKGQSNPIPAVFRMVDHGTLPNHFQSEIKDCFVVAEGWGDIASERAKYRLLTLSCVLENGDIVDADLKGTVVGEDGKEGLRGNLVERNGSLLGKTFLAGALSGFGNVAAEGYKTTSTSALGTVSTLDGSDVGKAGLAEGISSASEKLADYYFKRADEIHPIIEVGAGRLVEVVLTAAVDLNIVIKGNMKQGDYEDQEYYDYDDWK